ncbi:copper chaperone PCu(A)C [Streptomyces sp. SID12501]|uniref:Copper chaperone PCu(A)C n=1 Tax=Streptomyces sp. SID12501 TaxID=2706042 RepID=A0A6B3BFN1_9ACTN|nr:copper chaperone PCu(A)C [Streptomyces sp. SID12501]NEC85277.1 copper chaperone PCu(A)C [Streptomyces sp. SID12501]
MTDQRPWRPTRRRLTDTLLAALAPVAVCGLALGGLSTWTAYGNAGGPARIKVTEGKVFAPSGATPVTAAFFRITNSGGAVDRLVKVTTTEAGPGVLTLNRHVMTSSNTATDETVASVAVPPGDSLDMSPDGLDVIVPVKKGWQPGDLVAFTLHFEHTGVVKTLAVVVGPGQDST